LRHKDWKLFTLIVAVFTVLSLQVSAEDAPKTPITDETLSLKLGAFVTTFSSKLRLDADRTSRGTTIDLEDDLDLESPTIDFRADLSWRFFDRHSMDATYYAISRKGNTGLTRSLNIGNNIFSKNTNVDSELDVNNYKLAYRYSFY